MNRLTAAQLHANAEALHALADGKQIQYWSEVLDCWSDCDTVDMEFEHRVKPGQEEQPAHKEPSLNVHDY